MSARVVVVGGGITGLSAAHALASARPDLRLTLLERRERLGGNIVTERTDGFVLDGGPDSFLRVKREGVELCKELGLESELVTTREESRRVYFVHDGALEPMPAGMALAVPTRIRPMIETKLLSLSGKLRMLGDLVLPKSRNEDDESIESFLGRRFGREAAKKLAAPLLGGIYAGDIGELSVRATFPQLVELEQRHGSLVRAFVKAQPRTARNGHPPSPFVSLRSGMGGLIDALASRLPAGTVRTGVVVSRISRREDGRWDVAVDGEILDADAVIVASPAHVAARVVADEPLARELAAIPYLSTATVFFGWPRAAVEHPLDGVGFVAPKGESALIAATWVTSKWDARAPEGHVLVRAFLGGVRSVVDIAKSSDDDLVAIAKPELERLMGRLGTAELVRVFRYVDANPQPVVGHPARMQRIRRRLAELPGLELAGAAYEGVGIPDCIRQGRAAADRILAERC